MSRDLMLRNFSDKVTVRLPISHTSSDGRSRETIGACAVLESYGALNGVLGVNAFVALE